MRAPSFREPVVTSGKPGAKIGFIAYGTSDYAVRESCDQLRDEYDIEADYLRLRPIPSPAKCHDFIQQHDRVYVVDQNRDAQMLGLMRLELERRR